MDYGADSFNDTIITGLDKQIEKTKLVRDTHANPCDKIKKEIILRLRVLKVYWMQDQLEYS